MKAIIMTILLSALIIGCQSATETAIQPVDIPEQEIPSDDQILDSVEDQLIADEDYVEIGEMI